MTGEDGGERRGYHHGDLRHALIDAAAAMLERAGPRGVTLRALAATVGVTHAAPYRHFRDKAALLAAVADQGWCDLAQRLRATRAQAAADLPTRARLAQLITAYLSFAHQRPALYRLMQREPGASAGADAAGSGRPQLLAALLGATEAMLADRPVPGPHEPRAIATVLWALLHGLSTLTMDGTQDSGSLEALREAAVDTLLAGFGS